MVQRSHWHTYTRIVRYQRFSSSLTFRSDLTWDELGFNPETGEEEGFRSYGILMFRDFTYLKKEYIFLHVFS